MNIKLLFLFLLLTGALVVSGCAGLASSAGDKQTASDNLTAPVKSETPVTTPSIPETPEAAPSTPEIPRVQPNPSPYSESAELGYLPASRFNLEYLTEEEKAEVLRIASEAIGQGVKIDPNSVTFRWVDMRTGTKLTVNYDAVEKGIPDVVGAREAVFYPAIDFFTGSGGWRIVVDLQTQKALDISGPIPRNTGPARNPNP